MTVTVKEDNHKGYEITLGTGFFELELSRESAFHFSMTSNPVCFLKKKPKKLKKKTQTKTLAFVTVC